MYEGRDGAPCTHRKVAGLRLFNSGSLQLTAREAYRSYQPLTDLGPHLLFPCTDARRQRAASGRGGAPARN
jgi:hypothetical protein